MGVGVGRGLVDDEGLVSRVKGLMGSHRESGQWPAAVWRMRVELGEEGDRRPSDL